MCFVGAVVQGQSPAPNTLSADDVRGGWRLLFDGKTFNGFRDAGGSWSIRDGTLVAAREPRILEDLLTKEEFDNFELSFEWRLESGGNSGVKYRIWHSAFIAFDAPSGYEGGKEGSRESLKPEQRGQSYNVGYEFQLLDDARHPDGRNGPDRRTGALYGVLAPAKATQIAPGQWNTARLMVDGNSIEHWVNGALVLATNLAGPEVEGAMKKRMTGRPRLWELYEEHYGRASAIAFQNHGDSVVEFRSIKIRELNY